MKRSLTNILAVFIFFGMITTLFADQISLLGTVQLGRTIFTAADTSVPVRFQIQNQSQDAWAYSANLNNATPVYSYQVFYISKQGQSPILVSSGVLQTTNAQNLDVGQSDVFAVGNIPLTSTSGSAVATGFYRIYITAPLFQDATIHLTVKPSAGGAFVVQ